MALVQEVLPIERVALSGAEAGIADDVPQLFFRGVIGDTRRTDYVFFEHDRANIIAAEAKAELQDFQSLRYPAGLHVLDVRQIEARYCERLQIFDRCCFVPFAAAEGGVLWLEAPGDERGESAGLFLQVIDVLEMIGAV